MARADRHAAARPGRPPPPRKRDGTGYPHRLAGEQVPLAARVFAAVEIWDALRSDRPYRKGWPERRVLEHIRSLSGSRLDPSVVEAFLSLMEGDSGQAPDLCNVRRIGPETLAAGQPTEIDDVPTGGESRATELIKQLTRSAEMLRRSEALRDEQAGEISRLALLSFPDDLTRLRNRRHFRAALDSGFLYACRQGQPVSALMLDVDALKSYNDAYGHQAGNVALRDLSEILRDEVRQLDLISLFGGEEFVVRLPSADAATGVAVAERLGARIADHERPLQRVTASIGVAITPPGVRTASDLLEAADAALYLSQQGGRDGVTHSEALRDSAPHQGDPQPSSLALT